MPIEVHGRLLAVLSAVTGGPTVVTREVPALFVTGTIATAHQALGLVDARRPHEVLHRRDSEGGLATQHGLGMNMVLEKILESPLIGLQGDLTSQS